MKDKISAIIINLNSLRRRLEWINGQNYNDPDAVDLMGDVAEWVCEIDEAVEAIEKSLTPAVYGKVLVQVNREGEQEHTNWQGTHPFIPSQEGKL
ncbi:MAG: hypothetical protein IPJ03_15220 [Ignavibacteriales bacterium]|nr:hypothetical protein [Ignavibacteriales bacterium]